MVMNYGVELTKQSGSNWLNSYPTPMVEYGVNNGPSGGQNSAFFECTSTSQCENDILNDWLYLRSIGFNSIRVAHFYPRYNENGLFFGFNGRETSAFLPFYTFSIDPFNSMDPGLVLLLNQYEKLMEIANNADVKLIFNMIGKSSDFTVISGPGNDELDYYTAFMEKLAIRVSSSPFKSAVLAYDLWNEPCYFDESNNKSKETTCEIISTFTGAIKAHGSTPLVTIGTCGSGDVWFYDPGILKVDFHSLHVYPDFKDFEDRTDPAIQQRAISRMFDELYWFNKNSPVPWIIGETGFASSIVLPLTFPGTNGAHGTLTDQADFVQQMLDATCNSGGSGFSWWAFQDGWYFGNSAHEAHWGMLERGYATGDVTGEKPMVNVFRNYSLPTDINSCGPSPVDETTLQTYNSNLTYFNPYQHPTNQLNTIAGNITDQDRNSISDAFIGGHNLVDDRQNTDPNDDVLYYHRVFSDKSGHFEIIAYDDIIPFNDEFVNIRITTAGAERFNYGWCCNIIPPNHQINCLLNRINFTYDTRLNNITLPSFTIRDLKGYNSIYASNITIHANATSQIIARSKIHLTSDFHTNFGSIVHIFCVPTFSECIDFQSYVMQRLAFNTNSSFENNKSIEIKFSDLFVKTNLILSPNPNNGTFNVSLESEDNQNIGYLKIFNAEGQEIYNTYCKGANCEINLGRISQGTYFLKVITSQKVIINKVVVY